MGSGSGEKESLDRTGREGQRGAEEECSYGAGLRMRRLGAVEGGHSIGKDLRSIMLITFPLTTLNSAQNQ